MLIHREEILLCAPPERVREFVLTPERIMDYYPQGLDCAVIDPGVRFWCRGKAGVSLLEKVPDECANSMVVLKVTTARAIAPPFTADKIRRNAFFTMIEDWEIQPDGTGTRLIKSWRDIQKYQLRWLPLGFIVRRAAKAESAKLKAAWDRAAGFGK